MCPFRDDFLTPRCLGACSEVKWPPHPAPPHPEPSTWSYTTLSAPLPHSARDTVTPCLHSCFSDKDTEIRATAHVNSCMIERGQHELSSVPITLCQAKGSLWGTGMSSASSGPFSQSRVMAGGQGAALASSDGSRIDPGLFPCRRPSGGLVAMTMSLGKSWVWGLSISWVNRAGHHRVGTMQGQGHRPL